MGEAVSNSLPLNIVTIFIPVLFYFLGLSSNLEQFKILFKEKKSLLYGFGIQLILLPLVGLLISEIFCNSLFAIAAVIVLIVPGGHVSGFLAHIKSGNVPLSVFLTSFACPYNTFSARVRELSFLVLKSEILDSRFL